MEKALKTLAGLWRIIEWHSGMEPGGHGQGIDHHPIGTAGMTIIASGGDHCCSGIEVFILKFANCATIDGIGPVCAETLKLQTIGTSAYLLIGCKTEIDLTMGDFRVLQ